MKVMPATSHLLQATASQMESTKRCHLYAEALERTPSLVTSTWMMTVSETTFLRDPVCPKVVWGPTVTGLRTKDLIVLRFAIALALKRTLGSGSRSTTTVGLETKHVDTVSSMTLKLTATAVQTLVPGVTEPPITFSRTTELARSFAK